MLLDAPKDFDDELINLKNSHVIGMAKPSRRQESFSTIRQNVVLQEGCQVDRHTAIARGNRERFRTCLVGGIEGAPPALHQISVWLIY